MDLGYNMWPVTGSSTSQYSQYISCPSNMCKHLQKSMHDCEDQYVAIQNVAPTMEFCGVLWNLQHLWFYYGIYEIKPFL